MSNIYHGSLVRFICDTVRRGLRSPRRVMRELLGHGNEPPPQQAARQARIESMVTAGDVAGATAYACEIAEESVRKRDSQTLSWISRPLERLEEYGKHGRYFMETRRLTRPIKKEWNGGELPDGTLVVDYKYRNVGLPLRHARMLAQAARRVKRCIALAEPRLVPLFQRSFPEVEVLADDADKTKLFAEADAVSCYTDLLAFFTDDARQLADSFVPLKADPDVSERIRRRYERENPGPFIGFSWGSSNRVKPAPEFREWSGILGGMDATFVSLQYGEVGRALKKLRKWSSGRLIHDETIDQMKDMDTFAAQLASLDAVISTSNTIAHLAGAMGIPSIVVLNDNFTQVWPFTGKTIGWYPETVLVRKEGRPWPIVLEDAHAELRQLLARGQR